MDQTKLSPYIDIRQKIHQNPELMYDVFDTAELVNQTLISLGYQTITGIAQTGLTAILDSGKPGPTVALRADMDALPLTEMNDLPYKSKNEGKMHACGHDGHTATLLAAADLLRNRTSEFSGKIKFIFQPAEEGGAGAKAMIDDGVLEGIEAIFGYHNMPYQNHQILTKAGTLMASADQFKITLKGPGGHAAFPHLTQDPIYASAQIIQALQGIASRLTNPSESVVVTIAKINAGTNFNVIPDTAVMEGTIRAGDPETRKLAEQQLYKICEQLAQLNNLECKVDFYPGYPPTINHKHEAKLVLETARLFFPEEQVKDINIIPTMGAEDFSYFLEEIPGCYFFVGNGEDKCLHSSTYNYNDDILPTATKMMMEVAIAYLNNQLD